MVVECTINVGFRSNFGTFRQSEHSKIPLRLAIINGFTDSRSTQPTTWPVKMKEDGEGRKNGRMEEGKSGRREDGKRENGMCDCRLGKVEEWKNERVVEEKVEEGW